uniref:Na_H_Exchanger domain-containing protein n=1 Tax=Wuchereria bancrofti TaxID=6293 RepID=A0A1I8ETW7_WUCBA
MQQTFRTLAFVAETCIFAYLGLALFTIKLQFEPMFVSWSILLCFVGRAFNVFPLAYLANKCRRPQISIKNQFIMWYSGNLYSINRNIWLIQKRLINLELQENRMSLHRITSKLLNADCSVNDSSLPMERPLVLLQ